MLRTILLIAPIYVSLLWSITLAGNTKRYSNPRIYLGWFMLIPLVIFISHFLYFAPLPAIYPYFDIVLQGASLLVFPAYYIYFRLLTVDDYFSFKVHYKFLLIPAALTIIYSIGVLFTPKMEFRAWLFDEQAYPNSPQLYFLSIVRSIIRLTYLIQVVLTVIGNFLLIRKYGSKAEQFYADVQDGRFNNAKMLNYSILFISISAFFLTALGRQFLLPKDVVISMGWSVFSSMLFIIGYMGFTQKPINPTFELETLNLDNKPSELTYAVQKKINHKLLMEFEKRKIYLNSQLNIMDVVQILGTNRTTISNLINQQYNQNFCSFVNGYRIEELARVYAENPEYTNEQLAECCGFGSLNSLKRAVDAKTGLSLSEWKKQIHVSASKASDNKNTKKYDFNE